MKMITRKLGTGLLILTVLGGAVGVTACSHPSPEKRAEWMTSKLSSKLDLNAEQKTKLEAVKQAFLDTRKAHTAERAKQFEEAKQAILSERLDAAKVKAMMAQKKKAFDEGFDSVFPKLAEFHASLTPEQKQKAAELMDKFSKHWED